MHVMFYRLFDKSMAYELLISFGIALSGILFSRRVFYIFSRVVQAATSKARRQSEHPSRQSLWYDKEEKQVKQVIQPFVCLLFLCFCFINFVVARGAQA